MSTDVHFHHSVCTRQMHAIGFATTRKNDNLGGNVGERVRATGRLSFARSRRFLCFEAVRESAPRSCRLCANILKAVAVMVAVEACTSCEAPC